MPLSWNEIKARALVFSREWKGEGSERAEAQSFWNGFFDVFGVDRRRVAVFEKQVDVTRAGRRVTHGHIAAVTKQSNNTIVRMLEHLQALGIVDEVTGYKRNRVYRYPAYLEILGREED